MTPPSTVDVAENADPIDSMSVGKLKQLLADHGVDTRGALEKNELRRLARDALDKAKASSSGAGGRASGAVGQSHQADVPRGWRLWSGPGDPLVDSQLRALGELMWMHALRRDVCLLAPRGAGKTTLVRRFASILGYSTYVTFCHNDMASHELLQRRTTDSFGSTIWCDSPVVAAARKGELAVLDGAHRLAPGALAGALASLLTDRCLLSLPDGSRLVSAQHWTAMLRSGLSEEDLVAKGVGRIHPAFRVVACAELPSPRAPWLSDEILSLFSFLPLTELTSDEQKQLVATHACPAGAQPTLREIGRASCRERV